MREGDTYREMIGSYEKRGAATFLGISEVFSEEALLEDGSEVSSDLVRIEEDGQEICQKDALSREGTSDSKMMQERTEGLVQTYFHSLGNISLLTRDEEIALAKRIEEENVFIRRIISTMSLNPELQENTASGGIGEMSVTGQNRTCRDLSKTVELLDSLIKQMGYEQAASATGIHSDELRMKTDMIHKASALASEARNELIARNLRLVINIAKRYVERGLPLLDLIQEGNIGLIKAIDKFDYKKGYRFSTCASWWIRQAITKGLQDQTKTIRVPANVMELYNAVAKTSRELASELGREPETREIAERLGVPPKKVEQALQAIQDPVALETLIGDDGTTLGDFVGDCVNSSPYADTESNNIAEQILEVLHTLTERESIVLRMRFGIASDRTYTLSEVGRHLSITSERVRQIEAKAMKKLKQPGRIKKLEDLIAT